MRDDGCFSKLEHRQHEIRGRLLFQEFSEEHTYFGGVGYMSDAEDEGDV
jgi:hypothetical protein